MINSIQSLRVVEIPSVEPSYFEKLSLHSQTGDSMQYALLIYETAEAFTKRELPQNQAYMGAWRAYHQAMVEAGIYLGGNPLRESETGTTVRIANGKRSVQDGPYANTKEQLGGFVLLELPSLDAALEWAARCPAASYGAVEVRPIAAEAEQRVTGVNS